MHQLMHVSFCSVEGTAVLYYDREATFFLIMVNRQFLELQKSLHHGNKSEACRKKFCVVLQ